MKGEPDAALYDLRKQSLALLEKSSEKGEIDLYYGDESHVCEEGYVPYGWQFKDEKVVVPVAKGKKLNCFGLLSRQNDLIFNTTPENIDADFILQQLENLSRNIRKQTVVVLDNATVHVAKKIKERFNCWQERGLYIFYLPPYSPHLNIIERLWKELKARWLRPSDYQSADQLFYATWTALATVGKNLNINFGTFKYQ